MGELEEKVAVVTGAASGIGLACAARLVAEGAVGPGIAAGDVLASGFDGTLLVAGYPPGISRGPA